ncbi:hypothetical protein C6500_08720 [Candidatus Poribacteria bacterium]|nr:MAG: hypothetical protein C6500_08720 [Candidatus Poribacteria bacterium]
MINLCNALNSLTRLQVHAHWEPIADSTFRMHQMFPEHIELFDLSPTQPIKEYQTDAFNAFLPLSTVTVGDVWELDANSIVSFLHQFHPGATADLGYGEEGAFACLRANSSDYAEIVFRFHAEFTLKSAVYQEWQAENDEGESEARFIPSQFVGKVLINLKNRTVRTFSLALPARNTNVDLNAYGGADMVFVPRMELLAADEADQDEISWDAALTTEETRRALELKFYKFAEIDWLPVDEAVTQAKASNRPIHAILVWGCLDDESC